MDTLQNEPNKKQSAGKHFSGKDLFINFLIAAIPASVIIAILDELGLRGALVMMGVLYGSIYLTGYIREKIAGRSNSLPTKKSL